MLCENIRAYMLCSIMEAIELQPHYGLTTSQLQGKEWQDHLTADLNLEIERCYF